MSGKKIHEIAFFVTAFCVLTCHLCLSLSIGNLEHDFAANKVQQSTAPKWIRIDPQGNELLPDDKMAIAHKQHKDRWQGSPNASPGLSSFEMESVLRQLQENGIHLKSLSLSSGNVSLRQNSPTFKSGNGYQSDYRGFHTFQGEILGVPHDTIHLSEWRAMRPLVHCDQNVMTFTASGGGFTNLFVSRDGGTPISFFDLPAGCGFIVTTKWGNLEVTVPFDACYIIEEDGNIVLPLEWWGSRLKLSCPMWSLVPPPVVYCSPYGMIVQIEGQQKDLPTLGFKVDGRWGPFVVDECASLFSSQPKKFLFFVPTSAMCITVEHGVHLWLVIDEQEYTLSCPEFPLDPPSFPSEPQFPFFPDLVSPAPPSAPPQTTQQHLDSIYLNPKFPQIYPPVPQIYPPAPKLPTHTVDAPPGPRPLHHVHSLVPSFNGGQMTPFQSHLPPPPVKSQASVTTNINVGQNFIFPPNIPNPPGLSQMFNPSHFYPSHHTKPTVSPPQMPNFQHFPRNTHFFEYPYNLGLQVTPTPSPTPQAVPLKPLGLPLPPVHFPSPYTDLSFKPHHFYPQTSVNIPSPLKPPISQTVPEPHKYCFPFGDKLCPYYHSPYNPYYHPPQSPMYPPVPQPTVPAHPPPQEIQHYCLGDRIFVRLPFAHPDSIQVKDQTNVWHLLSKMPTFCLYSLHRSDGAQIILHTPVPGCHTYSMFDSSTSLSLRYWDTSLAHFRTVDVQCREPAITPPPLTRSPPTPTFIFEPPTWTCSLQHLTIVFPAGPISEISLKDLYGNKVKLQDVSKECGYSTSVGNDGKISLNIPLHRNCHMIFQGSMYTVSIEYSTIYGTREAQFSCPGGTVPVPTKDCDVPMENRLHCGPASVSQDECIFMGCCFSKYHHTCYYRMDECTADRHFVFSVPASLTEPPLSLPLLLVGGNSSCKPERVTSDCALFKVPMDGCGARTMQIGKTVIYMLEVNNVVNSISLNYGTITRDSPVRLIVECRFLPGSALSVSYMVKTPTLGPAIQTQGTFGVQLRIAKNPQYTSYYPQYHQPLQVLLNKPLYLEVRLLNSPDPSLVLLVHYCVAYPRSVKAVWVLLYNGCPNPLDPHPNQVVVSNPKVDVPSQTRRFTISTFQFLPDGKYMDSNEEIYIMCGTELCSTREGPCVEGCFAQ